MGAKTGQKIGLVYFGAEVVARRQCLANQEIEVIAERLDGDTILRLGGLGVRAAGKCQDREQNPLTPHGDFLSFMTYACALRFTNVDRASVTEMRPTMLAILPGLGRAAMLIIGDDSKSNGKVPWVTFSLIALNIVVYCAQCFLGEPFTRGFSLVPKEISTLTDLTSPQQVHAKIPNAHHLLSGERKNSLSRGDGHYPASAGAVSHFSDAAHIPVPSRRLDSSARQYVVFGPLWPQRGMCARPRAFPGVLRGLRRPRRPGVHGQQRDVSFAVPWSQRRISGVLGAYIAIHPLNSVSLWFGFYIGVIQLPAFVVIGVWFFFQYLAAFQSLELAGTNLGGTAYWDHVGGFAAGVVIIWGMILYLKYQQANQPPPDEEQESPCGPIEAANGADDPFHTFLPEAAAGRTAQEGRHTECGLHR